MQIQKNYSLHSLNTFHIDVEAEEFVRVETENELLQAIAYSPTQHYVLGGGSNVLLTHSLSGLTILNSINGIDIIDEDNDYAFVKFASGENWHQCVLWSIERNLGGIENLSLIPGTIGAAPIQNIGAYGVEIKDVLHKVDAIKRSNFEYHSFTNADCNFSYRESVFKSSYKDEFVIIAVTLKLKKNPTLCLDYGTIKDELKKMNLTSEPSIQDVSQAVIRIRQSKLPNPAIIGNAGSFFKNPVISIEHYNQLKQQYEDIPGYRVEQEVKVPAGWLIEQLGWKGYRKEDYGVHANQALVLVNYGQAKGKDILDLSTNIIESVHERFQIHLHREVNIW